MPPHIANLLLGSFGIVAAFLLIGGSIVLRAQQNRHRYDLARRALDAGTPLPPAPPLWVGLRRQAYSIAALGLGLFLVGGGAWVRGAKDAKMLPIPVAATQPALPPPPRLDFDGRPRPPEPPPLDYQRDLWQGAQERITLGQTALGCGVILTILGTVRIGTARAERKGY